MKGAMLVKMKIHDRDGELLSGALPVKQRRILDGWMALHEEEAYAAWNLAVQGKQFERIVPAM
ncbi:MAG: DUF4160 domain-containing protein [Kiritimatiellae bacterium]|nr:DUF4160 domain-containing protein [Kiritimatiellia bacterium]